MSSSEEHPKIAVDNHKAFMTYALEKARLSPPAPNKFCVGAILVDADTGTVLSTGYSLEFPRDYLGDPGTTHAEQCCLIKISLAHNNLPESRLAEVLPLNTALYTTMEPCNERLSGNKTCVERVLGLKERIRKVFIGIAEPGTFIERNEGKKRLEEAGVEVGVIEEMHDEVLEVSLAGHEGHT